MSNRQADLLLRGPRLLTLAPLGEERPRAGPAAGDVGATDDGWVDARYGAVVATGHGASWERLQLIEGAAAEDVGGRVVMPGFVDPHTPLLLRPGALGRVRRAARRVRLPRDPRGDVNGELAYRLGAPLVRSVYGNGRRV